MGGVPAGLGGGIGPAWHWLGGGLCTRRSRRTPEPMRALRLAVMPAVTPLPPHWRDLQPLPHRTPNSAPSSPRVRVPAPPPVFPPFCQRSRGDRTTYARRGIGVVLLFAGIALAAILAICGFAAWLVLADLLR